MTNNKSHYLNNTQLAKLIHKSKLTYCSIPEEDNVVDYDAIVNSLDEITEEMIDTVLEKKAISENRDKADILKSDLVFRVYDTSHSSLPNTKLPFPAFKHYVWRNGTWKEVLRSHWLGTIEDGHFSISHGNMIPELTNAFILLCNKIGCKGNYRNYSYLDDMKSSTIAHLLKVGLKFDDAKDNAFSYYTTIVDRSFKNFLTNEKNYRTLKSKLRMEQGMDPSHSHALDYELGFREE